MKIATWNVNSLKVRLPHLLDWLAEQQPDALCLQETKLEDAQFPARRDRGGGLSGRILAARKPITASPCSARQPIGEVVCGHPHFPDEQKRLIAGTVGDTRVICAYMSERPGRRQRQVRLQAALARPPWPTGLADEVAAHPKLALCGDYNIAPDDRDVHDPNAWAGQISAQRTRTRRLPAPVGPRSRDSFRLFEQPEKTFSWWDYRMLGFQKNLGLRIDHVLLSSPLARRCTAAGIDRAPRKRERPSDHAPVWATLA